MTALPLDPVRRPTPCVGVVCLRGDEVLLIRRGRAPKLGQWSIPGGRMEWGEQAKPAALRELLEETGVVAEITGLIDVIDALYLDEDRHYLVVDYAARWISGEPVAGDDAMDAGFYPLDVAYAMLPWEETHRVIREAHERFGGTACA